MGSQNNVLKTILSSKRTVFTTQSLIMLTGISDNMSLSKMMNYYVKKGDILNLRRGIYAKVDYDKRELACSILPSYRSDVLNERVKHYKTMK